MPTLAPCAHCHDRIVDKVLQYSPYTSCRKQPEFPCLLCQYDFDFDYGNRCWRGNMDGGGSCKECGENTAKVRGLNLHLKFCSSACEYKHKLAEAKGKEAEFKEQLTKAREKLNKHLSKINAIMEDLFGNDE